MKPYTPKNPKFAPFDSVESMWESFMKDHPMFMDYEGLTPEEMVQHGFMAGVVGALNLIYSQDEISAELYATIVRQTKDLAGLK